MFGAHYATSTGERSYIWMGSYGLGIGRTLACVAEHHHDEFGLSWPDSVAPFDVALVSVQESEDAEAAYAALLNRKIDVLFDDRDVAAGVKFADADLSGIPWRIVVSPRSHAQGGVELSRRRGEQSRVVAMESAIAELAGLQGSKR